MSYSTTLLLSVVFKEHEPKPNKKAFMWDAYLPLANRTCFDGHQMSVLVVMGTQVNKFEQVFTDGTRYH